MSNSDSLAGLRKQVVLLQEFGAHIKPLTVGQLRAYDALKGAPGVEKVAWLVVASLCDADGKALLASTDEVADLDFQTCEKLCERIADVNGFGEGAADPKTGSAPTPA